MNSPESWYYVQGATSVGPLSRADMEGLIRAGTVRSDTLVWPGSGDWIPAGSSALSALFGGYGGYAPPPPPPPSPYMAPPAAKKGFEDFLPKDKRLRLLLAIIIIIIGLFAMKDGLGEIASGLGGSSDGAQIQIQGCVGTSMDTMQCSFMNTGMVKGRVCMDVVVMCSDGRHVASTCSDRMDPGMTSSKTVKNFKPKMQPTSMCNNVSYENLRT